MANILSTFLKQVVTGDQIKDWDHAARLFLANNYELAPKTGFLFHVFFDVNPLFGPPNIVRQQELGMLVKTIQLPKISVKSDTLNAYGRKNVVQTSITYDPIQITAHDDGADVLREFWANYFAFYYRDSDHGGTTDFSAYANAHGELIGKRDKNWGYGRQGDGFQNYLSAIRIYSMHNKQFSQYVLINPIITSFANGQHAYAETTSTVEVSMTIAYEAVLYSKGTKVTQNSVYGFGDLHYDQRPSPLSPAGGGTRSILGPGGVLETASEVVEDFQNGNILSGAFKAARGIEQNRKTDLGAIAITEAIGIGKSIIKSGSGQANPFSGISIPTAGGFGGVQGIGGPLGALFGTSNKNTGRSQ